MSVIAWLRALLVLACLYTVPALPARAADAEAPAEPPKAADVLRAMSGYLAKAGSFSYHAEVEFDQILPGGPKIRLAGALDVAAKRPGSLFVNYRDDVSARVVWLQGGRLTLFDPVAATYAEVSGPKDIDGMVDKLEKEHGVSLPLGELTESDPMAALMRGVDQSHWVGIHDVDGVFCHHLVLQRPDLDLQVFVEVGEKPLPRKLVFEYPHRPGSPQYTAWITEWSFAPPAADLFAAKLPADVARVEFLPVGEAR